MGQTPTPGPAQGGEWVMHGRVHPSTCTGRPRTCSPRGPSQTTTAWPPRPTPVVHISLHELRFRHGGGRGGERCRAPEPCATRHSVGVLSGAAVFTRRFIWETGLRWHAAETCCLLLSDTSPCDRRHGWRSRRCAARAALHRRHGHQPAPSQAPRASPPTRGLAPSPPASLGFFVVIDLTGSFHVWVLILFLEFQTPSSNLWPFPSLSSWNLLMNRGVLTWME